MMLRLIFILTLGALGLQPAGYAYNGHFTLAAESELTAGARTLTAEEEALCGRVSRPKGFKEQVWEF